MSIRLGNSTFDEFKAVVSLFKKPGVVYFVQKCGDFNGIVFAIAATDGAEIGWTPLPCTVSEESLLAAYPQAVKVTSASVS